MNFPKKSPPPLGGEAASKGLWHFGKSPLSTAPPPKNQVNFHVSGRRGLHLVEVTPGDPPNPPRPRRRLFEVQFHVTAGCEPHGRSRPFKIEEADLSDLLDTAARLEARP